jgi:hypothetical protein
MNESLSDLAPLPLPQLKQAGVYLPHREKNSMRELVLVDEKVMNVVFFNPLNTVQNVVYLLRFVSATLWLIERPWCIIESKIM